MHYVNEKGMALFTVLLLTLILSMLIGTSFFILKHEQTLAQDFKKRSEGMALASIGIERAKHDLEIAHALGSNGWEDDFYVDTDGSVDVTSPGVLVQTDYTSFDLYTTANGLGGSVLDETGSSLGSYEVKAKLIDQNTITVRSKGWVVLPSGDLVERVLEGKLLFTIETAFQKGVYSNNIVGTISGGKTPKITGDAATLGTITGDVTITGTSDEPTTIPAPTIEDEGDFIQQAQANDENKQGANIRPTTTANPPTTDYDNDGSYFEAEKGGANNGMYPICIFKNTNPHHIHQPIQREII